MLPWYRSVELALPPDGHDYTDDNCGRDNYAEKVLKDDRTRVGPGDALVSLVSQRSGLYLYPHGVGGL